MTTRSIRTLAAIATLGVIAAALFPIQHMRISAEADALASQLSWKSVGGDCIGTMLVSRPEGAAAERLEHIGRPATAALLRVLDDPERGVAAHLILTRIYHPDRTGIATEYHCDESRVDPIWGGPALVGGTHTVNGLSWQWYAEGDRLTAEVKDLQENNRRWEKELRHPGGNQIENSGHAAGRLVNTAPAAE